MREIGSGRERERERNYFHKIERNVVIAARTLSACPGTSLRFSSRFLADIELMPVAPGAVRAYRTGDAVVFCAFVGDVLPAADGQPDRGTAAAVAGQLERAVAAVKRSLAGRVHLAIQRNPSVPLWPAGLRRLFQTAFAKDELTLWLCGGEPGTDHVQRHCR